MKTIAMKNLDYPFAPYPNAASRREILHKIMDYLLIIASCVGITSAILLMFAMA